MRDRLDATTAVLAALSALAVVGTVALLEGSSLALAAVPVGALVGAGVLALALARFEVFVLAVLTARTTLDAFKFGDSAAAPDPGVLLGVLLLVTGVIWLLGHRRGPRPVPMSPLGWAISAFTGAALLGVIISPDLLLSFIEWSRLASVTVLFLIVERLATEERDRARYLVAGGLAVVVPLAVAAWQLSTDTGLFSAGGFDRITGTFTHSNPLAAFLALIVVVAAAVVVHQRRRRLRIVAAVLLVASLAGLYLTYTRAAWLAALVGLLVVAALAGRRVLAASVVALTLLAVLIPGVTARFADLSETRTSKGEPGNSLNWRFDYWAEAVQLGKDDPVTGIGLKQVADQSTEGKQPHSDVVRAYVELGVLGLLAYCAYLWQLIATARRAVVATRGRPGSLDRAIAVGALASATGYVVMGLVANLMSQAVVGIYYLTVAALASAIVRSAQASTSGAVSAESAGAATRRG